MEHQLTFYKQYKKLIIALLIVIVLALVSFSAQKGYRYANKYLKTLESEKQDAIEHVRDSMVIEVGIREFQLDSIKAIKNVKIPNYWRKYKNSENEKKKLIKYIMGLSDNIYTKTELDSLAKYYKY